MAASIIGSLPAKVQIGEKFRLDLSRTYVHVSEHSLHTMVISVEGTEYEILSEKYFDYDFGTTGSKTLSVTVSTSGQGHPETTKDFAIEVISESDENLFSKDSDITSYEPDILSYLPDGKGDYKYVHRVSQDTIVKWLDENGLKDQDGNKFTASALVHKEEVNRWSKFLTLELIFQSLSNAIDDFFHSKSIYYRDLKEQASQRTYISLDTNGDGEVNKEFRKYTGNLYR